MGFNSAKFNQAQLIPRQETIKAPGLAEYFDEGSDPAFIVRGLSGYEIGFCNEARDRNRNVNKLLTGLVSQSTNEVIEAVQKAIGIGLDVTDDIARRIEILKLGSVDPELDHETVKKICEHHAVIFYDLTNKILELTGGGSLPGKADASGATEPSEPV